MNRRIRAGITVVAIVLLCVLGAPLARAQVCGDADGSGTVTVTDGVQVLRAAATLSSSCSLALCDVDQSGGITVTDGVNVLRKAAGLPSTDNCALLEDQLEGLLGGLQPLLTIGLSFIPAGGADAHIAQTEQCPAGGSLEFGEDFVTFNACRFGDEASGIIEFNGAVFFSESSVSFQAFRSTVLSTGEFVQIDGTVTASEVPGGTSLTGTLDFASNFGGFSLALERLLVDAEGNILDGSVEIGIVDAAIDGVVAIRLDFDGTEIVQVLVRFEDQSTQAFLFNVNTGEITPA